MGLVVQVGRFDVFLINLDPTIGKEIKKTRPCLIISPDEMNEHIATFIVAPMTSKSRNYPSRVNCKFKGKLGQIVLDQIRTVDKIRLVKKLGVIDEKSQIDVIKFLQEMFAF
ncbi:MAG: type II toxin-antitoxin system PemK/MazF family toxin [Calditrichaceae bacterium]|nr:type II toxin-antitoxin system PemK/MazF family toxin [Calditrichaceae bacterium]